jgi:hypothetical protein
MRPDIEPLLHPVEIAGLRPTQITVGLREVARKRSEWRKHAERDGPDFLGRHMLPAVLGPKQRYHLIDNHHFARALHDEGIRHVFVRVVADLSGLDKQGFWTFMESRNWLHPYNANGKRQPNASLPRAIAGMTDDPYRSLAGELRRAGGYAKDLTPYAEFLWADFLRRRIDHKAVERDFEGSTVRALDLAHHKDAAYLPGWCGADE